jgi:hypothetical protein
VVAEPDRVEAELLGERGDAAHLLVRRHREATDGEGEDEAEVKVPGHLSGRSLSQRRGPPGVDAAASSVI